MAGRIVRPGPGVSRAKAVEVVDVLRASARRAAPLAAKLSRMEAADGREITADSLSRIYVVDRPGWALGAARSMQEMLRIGPQTGKDGEPDATDIASNVEVTAALTFLSRNTLGQFDPFGPRLDSEDPAGDPRGNLLLVAPNVLTTQRSMAVNYPDFALWVALHEQTHALQFAAAPWLTGYLQDLIEEMIGAFPTEMRLKEWTRTTASVLRGGTGLVDSLLAPEQRVIFAKITAAMSVLEGHADVIMDLVSAKDVADVAVLRRKFSARRTATNRRSELIMRLSGMDTKMDQYRTGAAFVQGVRRRVGLAGVNRVWQGPEFLPTVIELDSPAQWIERVAP